MTDIYMPDQGEMATEIDMSSSGTEAFHRLVERLSRQSVDKHFDAYGDIDWDAPEMLIDPGDPRWILSDMDPLGGTDWYRALHPGTQARIGLYRIASMMKVGAIFESVLKRGLIEFAQTLPDRSPEFRYAYHEMIEEAQHSLMFQEFVNRTGFDIPGLNTPERVGSRVIVQLGHLFPELFFVFVLGGGGPDRLRAAPRTRQGPGQTPIARAHRPDPRHRRGTAPVIRTPLPRGSRTESPAAS